MKKMDKLFTAHVPQIAAELITPPKNSVVISITNPGWPEAILKDGWDDVLRLCFEDATINDTPDIDESHLFDEGDAIRVIGFLNNNQDANILVHCQAGVSRSSAICQFIEEAFGHEIDWLFFGIPNHLGPPAYPNPLVRRLLFAHLWMRTLEV